MKKAMCVYLSENDIKDAFKKKGFDVVVDCDIGVLNVFARGGYDEQEKFNNAGLDFEEVIGEHIGEEVFSIVARDGDQWLPANFIAFLKNNT